MSKKILGTALGVLSIAAMFIPGGQVIGILGMKISVGMLVSVGIGLAAGILLKPKAPRVSGAATDRLTASFDPNAPRKIVVGHTAMATDVRYQSFSGSEQEYYHQILCVASHEAQSIDEIWFDSEMAWSASGGVASKFNGYLTVTARLVGTSSNGIAIDSVWTSTCTLTGCAYLYLRFKLTGNSKKAESPFASAIPSRVTVRGRGAKLPDVRELGVDAANQATWSWFDDDSGRNPAMQLLFYLIGWRINGKLAVGRGIPAERLDLDSFITAANLCDEPVSLAAGGTEPRYRSDGAFSEADDPSLVIGGLCAAMNAVLRDTGGKIGVYCLHNDLATPLAAFTEADIIDGDDWEQTPPLDEFFNVVRGRYVDPSDASLYQLVEYPEVRIDSVDDIERIDTFDVALVQSPSQAQRLAKQRLQRSLYRGVFSARFNDRAWQVNVGDVVTLSHRAMGWAAKLFRVAGHSIDITGVVSMVLQEEHASIYAWDAEEAAAIVPQVPTAYDPLLNPFVVAYYDSAGAGPQTLRDDTFMSSYWAIPAPAHRIEWTSSRNGYGVTVPFEASTDFRIYNSGAMATLAPAREGKPLFLRLVVDPSGFSDVVLVDDDGEILTDDDGIYLVDADPSDFDLEVSIEWLDITGAYLSRSIIATLDPGEGLQTAEGHAQAPAAAAFGRVSIGYPSQTGKTGGWVVYEPWLAEYQPAADNTQENQVIIVPPPMPVISADYQGTINADWFPVVLTPQVTRGGASIRTDDSSSYALANVSSGGAGAVTVNNTTGSADKGRITITDVMTATFTFDYIATVNGIEQPAIKFEIKVENAAPPTSGGGGGGGTTSGTFGATGSRTNTTFSEVGRVEDVVKGTGETITASAPVGYLYRQGTGSGAGRARMKWQYSVAGAESWTDFAAYVEGSEATWSANDVSGEPGSIICNQSVTPADGTYDVRLVASADAVFPANSYISFQGNTCTVSVG